MPQSKRIKKVIVFDLDGTLVNAYPAVVASVNYTLKSLGFKPKTREVIKRAVGWGDRQLLAQFVGEDLADRAIKLYRPHHAKALLTHVTFLPTAKQTLKALHERGFKLAICSNRPYRFTQQILDTLAIRTLFKIVACADKSGKPKPDPSMLIDIAKRLKIDLNEMIFVGDMTIDVATGNNAHVDTVAVTTGSSSVKELKALKPKAIIARISELKKWIK